MHPTELPGGFGAGVDHCGSGKVTHQQKTPLCSSTAVLNGPSVCPQHWSLLAPLSALLSLTWTLRKRLGFFICLIDVKTEGSVRLRKCVFTQKSAPTGYMYCTLCFNFSYRSKYVKSQLFKKEKRNFF